MSRNIHISPFAPEVRRARGAGNRRGVQVARKLRIRNTHLKREVFTQLEAIITEKQEERTRTLRGALLSFIMTVNHESNLEEFIGHSSGTQAAPAGI